MLHRMNIEERPEEFGAMSLDRWIGHYSDRFNDIHVSQVRGHKTWRLTERQRGNNTVLISRHRSLENALIAANRLYAIRHPWDAASAA